MPDREIVITHLQIIHTWAEFARERDLQFFTPKHLEDIAQWSDDAIALLKKKETQKFFVDESGKVTPLPVVVRCKDCKHRGNSYLCRFDRDLEEHGSHRTEADDDWFCADGQRKTACDGCENNGSEDCALGKPGSENAYCPNGKLR